MLRQSLKSFAAARGRRPRRAAGRRRPRSDPTRRGNRRGWLLRPSASGGGDVGGLIVVAPWALESHRRSSAEREISTICEASLFRLADAWRRPAAPSKSARRHGQQGARSNAPYSAAIFAAPAAFRAWSRSPRMSSMCSMPIDKPHIAFGHAGGELSSAESCECVVDAGWIASARASPMLATW